MIEPLSSQDPEARCCLTPLPHLLCAAAPGLFLYFFFCIEPDVYHISLLVYNKIIQKSFMKNVIQMSSDFRKRI
jgi:hypothetical protein